MRVLLELGYTFFAYDLRTLWKTRLHRISCQDAFPGGYDFIAAHPSTSDSELPGAWSALWTYHEGRPGLTNVYEIDPLRDSRWSEFLRIHHRASVFHTVSWLNALKSAYQYEPVVVTTSPLVNVSKTEWCFAASAVG